MELNDKEFDATFRKKVFDTEPQFEEAAWNKMEQKLKRRDRLVFLRKSAILCLLLSGFIGAYYMLPGRVVKQPAQLAVKEKDQDITKRSNAEVLLNDKKEILNDRKIVSSTKPIPHSSKVASLTELLTVEDHDQVTMLPVLPQVFITDTLMEADEQQNVQSGALKVVVGDLAAVKRKDRTVKRKLPLSLSLTAGPEFNSSESLIGGKAGFSAGLSAGYGITKKLSILAGFKYSLKDYSTNNYGYQFSSQRVQNLITDVDASCAVLEIPIQASYIVADNHKGSLSLNAGISSYLMLKEDYTFRYTPQSGISDHLLQKRNENQHFLSVVDLSATYFIKQRNNKLKLGFEPFVKIPLTGVGEGKVNLKSSGISLKLRYDLDKKNN